eukprot:1260371-Alexandrium_andersonii.AAC.1
MYAGATRFDRFDSLLGSIATRFMCHRVPPCEFPSGSLYAVCVVVRQDAKFAAGSGRRAGPRRFSGGSHADVGRT